MNAPTVRKGIIQRAGVQVTRFLIKVYRLVLKPWLPNGACRFQPTCSQYLLEAVEKHGFIKGFCKGIWRILRCHPGSRGGYDPA